MERAAGGDQSAMAQLYNASSARVFGLAVRILGETRAGLTRANPRSDRLTQKLCYSLSSSSRVLASFRSAVSIPSVNQL